MEFTFIVKEEEANLILKGLGKLPAEESMNLIIKINQDARKQIEDKKNIEQQ